MHALVLIPSDADLIGTVGPTQVYHLKVLEFSYEQPKLGTTSQADP